MAGRYKLSWLQDSSRWRKRYKGRQYYFKAPEGKVASYQRCYREWLKLKSHLDAVAEGAAKRNLLREWQPIIAYLRECQQSLIDDYGDTERVREAWQYLERNWMHRIIGTAISAGLSPSQVETWSQDGPIEGLKGELAVDSIRSRELYFNEVAPGVAGPASFPRPAGTELKLPDSPVAGPPPWEHDYESIATIEDLGKQFIRSAKQDVSPRRAKNLERDVLQFVNSLPTGASIADGLTSQSLDHYMQEVKQLDVAASTKRDKLAAVSQFSTWAFERDYIETIPRLIAAGKFRIEVSSGAVDVLEDSEVNAILNAAAGRTRLYILLGLNCGFTQVDIADLTHAEVNLSAGKITRKRSKTKDHNTVPEVTWILWTETLALLKEFATTTGEHVLVNAAGNQLVRVKPDGGRTDGIAKAMQKLRKDMKRKGPIGFKKFRSTAASKLGEHNVYRQYAQHFLCHAPSNTADAHYVKPSQKQFDKAVFWLEKQFLK